MTVKVKNRSNSTAVYTVPELGDKRNIRREFAPHEEKVIAKEELDALTFIPGGTTLLSEYLQIMDEGAQKEIGLEVEPEYNLSEDQIKELLVNGDYDQFLDTLDFAPTGVLDLIKQYAVSLPLNDHSKREAIREKLNFDVDKALLHNREMKDEENASTKNAGTTSTTKERRVKPTTTPKYNIVG